MPWSTSPAGKGRYVASDHSFLFSLHSPGGLNIRKFDIKKKMFAVSHHPNCGPIFGAGADLFISDNCNKVIYRTDLYMFLYIFIFCDRFVTATPTCPTATVLAETRVPAPV